MCASVMKCTIYENNVRDKNITLQEVYRAHEKKEMWGGDNLLLKFEINEGKINILSATMIENM